MRRAKLSVTNNIAEGYGRFHFGEKIQFYNIAKGSTLEVQNHVIEANNSDYINQTMYDNYIKRYHVVEVKLNNLIASMAKAKKSYATKSKRK